MPAAMSSERTSRPSRVRRENPSVIFECESKNGACLVSQLRAALDREQVSLREKDALIEQIANLRSESDHRLLNDLQLVASLISMQSRVSAHAETKAQLAVAANRVATIGRIHRRLHSFDGAESVSVKPFLEGLCSGFAGMLSQDGGAEQIIAVEAIDVQLPTALGIPLGFIVSELVTNALKYGSGRIEVKLVRDPRKGCALSVVNEGPPLPEGFSPSHSKGLGMPDHSILCRRDRW